MLTWLRETRLPYYDVQTTLSLNPLNWEFGINKYDFRVRTFKFGPLRTTVFYGD